MISTKRQRIIGSAAFLSKKFSSVQDGTYVLGKSHTRYTPSPRSFHSVALYFRCWSDWRWPFLVLSMKIAERFLFLRPSPLGDRWCDVLGFVPAGSVSSSSPLQIFRDATRLWWLLFPPVYLLCHFLWLRLVQDSTPIGFSEGGCPTCQSGLPIPLFTFSNKGHFKISFERNMSTWNSCLNSNMTECSN